MVHKLRSLTFLMPLLAAATLACSAPDSNSSAIAAPAKVASSDPALWVLSDEDTTIYLFGTVHMMKPGVVWFDDEIKAAFDKSDELVLEVTSEKPENMAMSVAMMGLNEGKPTRELLEPKLRERYLKALETYQIPAAAMDRIEPWLVAINLSIAPLAKLGYHQDLGAEKILETAAIADGKTVKGLETTEEQLGYFDTLPRDVQTAYLRSTVEELPTVKTEFAKLMRAWQHGDPDTLASLMNESIQETPEMAQVLLYDRNANWVRWIEKRMDTPGTVFLAVGAGHLAGKGSVVELLNADKLSVRRLSKKDFGLK